MVNIKGIVRNNKLSISILLFLIIFTIIHYIKPSVLYNPDGSFREFGVGYTNKTVVPIWLISIILAILSYLAVISYLMYY
jgi:hypothetical protein